MEHPKSSKYMPHVQGTDIETLHANQLFQHLFMIGDISDTCISLLYCLVISLRTVSMFLELRTARSFIEGGSTLHCLHKTRLKTMSQCN